MKKRRSQAEMAKQLSDRQLVLNLYMTQCLLMAASLMLGWFLFDGWIQFFRLFRWEFAQIMGYGGGLAVLVIALDLILMKYMPENQYDDGGINERMFSILPAWHIFIVTLFIAVVEEILFRGVLQANFGLIAASLVFAVLHVRYLRKAVLFGVTVAVSFLLGVLFYYTGNLFVPMFAHFMIDFILGLVIRMKHLSGEAKFMEHEDDNGLRSREADGGGDSQLPPRREYHRRRKRKEKKRKNPFLLARVVLAVFVVLVAVMLAYSIYQKYLIS